MVKELQHAYDNDLPVVYLDEVVFTKTSIGKRTWTNRGVHLVTDHSEFYSGFRTVIAAVSSAMGIILTDSEEVCTNEERFLKFIPKLSTCMGGEPFALYLDQLIVHKMKTVRAEYDKYNIYPIYNIPASPEMNPIETCFAQVKRIYKRERMNALVNKRQFDMDDTIDKAFKIITP